MCRAIILLPNTTLNTTTLSLPLATKQRWRIVSLLFLSLSLSPHKTLVRTERMRKERTDWFVLREERRAGSSSLTPREQCSLFLLLSTLALLSLASHHHHKSISSLILLFVQDTRRCQPEGTSTRFDEYPSDGKTSNNNRQTDRQQADFFVASSSS